MLIGVASNVVVGGLRDHQPDRAEVGAAVGVEASRRPSTAPCPVRYAGALATSQAADRRAGRQAEVAEPLVAQADDQQPAEQEQRVELGGRAEPDEHAGQHRPSAGPRPQRAGDQRHREQVPVDEAGQRQRGESAKSAASQGRPRVDPGQQPRRQQRQQRRSRRALTTTNSRHLALHVGLAPNSAPAVLVVAVARGRATPVSTVRDPRRCPRRSRRCRRGTPSPRSAPGPARRRSRASQLDEARGRCRGRAGRSSTCGCSGSARRRPGVVVAAGSSAPCRARSRSAVSSSTTRTGVHHGCPAARRPSGPPTPSLSAATTGSSASGGRARRSPAPATRPRRPAHPPRLGRGGRGRPGALRRRRPGRRPDGRRRRAGVGRLRRLGRRRSARSARSAGVGVGRLGVGSVGSGGLLGRLLGRCDGVLVGFGGGGTCSWPSAGASPSTYTGSRELLDVYALQRGAASPRSRSRPGRSPPKNSTAASRRAGRCPCRGRT